jgi:hypothetical protein
MTSHYFREHAPSTCSNLYIDKPKRNSYVWYDHAELSSITVVAYLGSSVEPFKSDKRSLAMLIKNAYSRSLTTYESDVYDIVQRS